MTSKTEGWGLKKFHLLRYAGPYSTLRQYQGVAITDWEYYPAPSGGMKIYQVHRVALTTMDTFTDRSDAIKAAKRLYSHDTLTGYPPYQPTGDGDQLLT